MDLNRGYIDLEAPRKILDAGDASSLRRMSDDISLLPTQKPRSLCSRPA